jgi:hypothetical protein
VLLSGEDGSGERCVDRDAGCDLVDVLRRERRVETALSEVGGRLVEATPKTEASVRVVPVPVWLVGSLRCCLRTRARTTTS